MPRCLNIALKRFLSVLSLQYWLLLSIVPHFLCPAPERAFAADKKSAGSFLPAFLEAEVSTSAPFLAPASFLTRGYGIAHLVDSPWSVLGIGLGATIQDFTIRLGMGTYPFMWTVNSAAVVDWNLGDAKSGRISPFAGISYNYANQYQFLYQRNDNNYELETADFAFSMGYLFGVRYVSEGTHSYAIGFRHDPILYKSESQTEVLGLPSANIIKRTQPRVPFTDTWGIFGFIGWIIH